MRLMSLECGHAQQMAHLHAGRLGTCLAADGSRDSCGCTPVMPASGHPPGASVECGRLASCWYPVLHLGTLILASRPRDISKPPACQTALRRLPACRPSSTCRVSFVADQPSYPGLIPAGPRTTARSAFLSNMRSAASNWRRLTSVFPRRVSHVPTP